MKGLLKYLDEYKKECVLAPLFKMLEASFELLIPLVVARVINVGIAGGDKSYIIKMCLVMVLLGLTGLASSVTAQFFAAKAATGFAGKLRHDLFDHIQSLSYTSLDKVGTSTLITRMTSDVNQAQNGVNMFLRLFLRSPFIVFGAVIMAVVVGGKRASVFLYTLPILVVVVFAIVFLNIPMYKKVQKALDEVTLSVRENLNGVRVLRAFNKEEAEIDKFVERNNSHALTALFAGRISALLNPLTYVIINIALVILLKSGALAVFEGELKQGDVVALVNYMSQILIELVKLANLVVTLTKAMACATRISEVLEIPTSVDEKEEASGDLREEDKVDKITDDSYIRFENVSFRYEGLSEDVLSDISFSVNKGETIGIIGATGSGKSSLMQLLPGFYDINAGRISLEGRDIKDIPTAVLRKKIGYVPQKAALFEGSVRDNLLFGNPDASEIDMEEALKASISEDFVYEKEGGLDAKVEHGGRNFSGGQKQRLTIARALTCKPKILILDDSSSALDHATDAKLRKEISELPYDPTVFIISQRTVGIMNADKIIVLDDGKIVGMGKHETLLKECDVYREIYESQYKGVNE